MKERKIKNKSFLYRVFVDNFEIKLMGFFLALFVTIIINISSI